MGNEYLEIKIVDLTDRVLDLSACISQLLELTDELFESFHHFERDPFATGNKDGMPGGDEGSVKGWQWYGEIAKKYREIKERLGIKNK